MNKVAIMQPYLFPYIGYFQLLRNVDQFVVYDNIQYTKKGWINRNRILVNGKDEYISVPLKKDSDFLDVKDRYLADTWDQERKKTINKIKEVYRKAPHSEAVMQVIEKCLLHEDKNLFNFIYHSLSCIKQYLGISTPLVVSSTLNIDHDLRSEEKVMAICKALNATHYINPIGGVELYNKEEFLKEGLELQFLKANNVVYPQFSNEFMPFLSIIDVMMFNSKEQISGYLNKEFTIS
jgi:hypothetical protein